MNFEYGIGVSSSLHLGINTDSNFAIHPPSLYAKTIDGGYFASRYAETFMACQWQVQAFLCNY